MKRFDAGGMGITWGQPGNNRSRMIKQSRARQNIVVSGAEKWVTLFSTLSPTQSRWPCGRSRAVDFKSDGRNAEFCHS